MGQRLGDAGLVLRAVEPQAGAARMGERHDPTALLILHDLPHGLLEPQRAEEAAHGQSTHRDDDARAYQRQFAHQIGGAQFLLGPRGYPVPLAARALAGVTLGDGGHVLRGAELGLFPANLGQPAEEAGPRGAVEGAADLGLGDTGGLADDHHRGGEGAGEDRARRNGMSRLQAAAAGPHVGMERGQCLGRIVVVMLAQWSWLQKRLDAREYIIGGRAGQIYAGLGNRTRTLCPGPMNSPSYGTASGEPDLNQGKSPTHYAIRESTDLPYRHYGCILKANSYEMKG